MEEFERVLNYLEQECAFVDFSESKSFTEMDDQGASMENILPRNRTTPESEQPEVSTLQVEENWVLELDILDETAPEEPEKVYEVPATREEPDPHEPDSQEPDPHEPEQVCEEQREIVLLDSPKTRRRSSKPKRVGRPPMRKETNEVVWPSAVKTCRKRRIQDPAKYLEYRQKNNESAAKSRLRKKMREAELLHLLSQLEEEHMHLKNELYFCQMQKQ